MDVFLYSLLGTIYLVGAIFVTIFSILSRFLNCSKERHPILNSLVIGALWPLIFFLIFVLIGNILRKVT